MLHWHIFKKYQLQFSHHPPQEILRSIPNILSDEEFNGKVHDLIRDILTKIKPKTGLFGEQLLTGPLFAKLINEYERRITQPGSIPDIENSWYAAIFLHLNENIEKLVQHYTDIMRKVTENKFPMEVGSIDDESKNTLCGCHNSTLSVCEIILDEDVKKLVTNSKSDRFKGEIRKLHEKLRKRCGSYTESMKECIGVLQSFHENNFQHSREKCTSTFHNLYRNVHENISCCSLKEMYLDQTKAMGPAKLTVLDDELEWIPGCPTSVSIIEKKPRYVTVGWNQPSNRPSVTAYEIQMIQPKSEWILAKLCGTGNSDYEYTSKLSPLHPNSHFSFHLRGRNERRVGECSNQVLFTTPSDRPDAPLTPKCKVISPSVVNVAVEAAAGGGYDNGSPVTAVVIKWCFQSHCTTKMDWKAQEKCIRERGLPLSHDVQIKSFNEEGCYSFAVHFINDVGKSESSKTYRSRNY